MAEPFLAEVRMMSFNFPPQGWALCNGQLLPINQNQALFALLGTTYGGDGEVNFALPNLRGRVPIHVGGGFTLGQRGGEEAHTLTINELPAHAHMARASTATNGATPVPTNAVLTDSPSQLYGPPSQLTTLTPATVAATGGSQPHLNQQPFSTISFCIALQGIFPSQS